MRGSLNRYAPKIIESGIFNNVRNFKDFLLRISRTKDLNKRGISKPREIFLKFFLRHY